MCMVVQWWAMVGEAAKGAAAEGEGRSRDGTEAELVVSRWLSEEVNFRRKVEVVVSLRRVQRRTKGGGS